MAKRIKKEETTVSGKSPEVQLVEKMISYALHGKQDSKVVDNYNRGIRYWKGIHKISERSPSQGNKVYNKFAEIIETRIAQLTDARPKWIFRPQESGDLEVTSALNQILGDVVWDYIDWDHGEDGGGKAEDTVLQAFYAGSSHIKTLLDTTTGYPNFIVIPVGSILVDPKAKKKKQLRYWIHLVPTSVKEIKRKYGFDVMAQADLERIFYQDGADFHNPQITGQLDTVNSKFPSEPFLVSARRDDSPNYGADFMGRAIVAEAWVEDFTREEIPYSNEETDAERAIFLTGQAPGVSFDQHHPRHIAAHTVFLNSLDPNVEGDIVKSVQDHIDWHSKFPQESSRLKYPYGRVITICQGKLLSDRPNPFGVIGLDFKDVLIKWDYHKNPEGYWGKPGTSDLFDPQDDLNHRKNSITRNINLLNVGIRKIKWSLYEKLGIKDEPGKLNNMPGNIIPFLQNPDEFTTDFGSPMPPQVWGDISWTERFMETQSLHQDAAAGRLPAPGTANVTLETLLGEFKTILRKPLRHYAGALEEMAKNAILIMSKWMDPQEVFMILGSDGQTYQRIEWASIKDRAAVLRNVRIDVVNMLPTHRMETFRKVIEMMQAGVPPEAAIQLLDDPKAIQVMQTMSQINQLKGVLDQVVTENKQLKEQLNTMLNRMQGEGGLGNVGAFKTGGK